MTSSVAGAVVFSIGCYVDSSCRDLATSDLNNGGGGRRRLEVMVAVGECRKGLGFGLAGGNEFIFRLQQTSIRNNTSGPSLSLFYQLKSQNYHLAGDSIQSFQYKSKNYKTTTSSTNYSQMKFVIYPLYRSSHKSFHNESKSYPLHPAY